MSTLQLQIDAALGSKIQSSLSLRAEVEKARGEYNLQIGSLRTKQNNAYDKLQEVTSWCHICVTDNHGRADFFAEYTKNQVDIRNAKWEHEQAEQKTKAADRVLYQKELRLLVVLMDIQKDIVEYWECNGTSSESAQNNEGALPKTPVSTAKNPYLNQALSEKEALCRELRADLERFRKEFDNQINRLLDKEGTKHQLFLIEREIPFDCNSSNNCRFHWTSKEDLPSYKDAEEDYWAAREERVNLERELLAKETRLCKVLLEIQDLWQAFPETHPIHETPQERLRSNENVGEGTQNQVGESHSLRVPRGQPATSRKSGQERGRHACQTKKRLEKIHRLREDIETAHDTLLKHSNTYEEQFRRYVTGVGLMVSQKYGEQSQEKSEFFAARGKYSDEVLEDKFTPLYFQHERAITQEIALAEIDYDMAIHQAKAFGAPNYTDQSSSFVSDSDVDMSLHEEPEFSPEALNKNRKRVEDWRGKLDVDKDFHREEIATVSDSEDNLWDTWSAKAYFKRRKRKIEGADVLR
jgi:hypothetical protein